MPTDTTAKGQIQFIQNHQTALNAGEYNISIEQSISITIDDKDKTSQKFTSNLTFVVQGNRFELNPQDIHSVFPPAGSSGDHSHVLPHIVLKRSTFPWEREALSKNQNVPWLALLVIYEEEEEKHLLKTLQKQQLNSLWKDETTSEKTKKVQKLWECLVKIGWLKSINNDEALIVDKRKTEILEDNFTKFEEQIEAIFAQVKTTKVIPLKNLTQNYANLIKWNAITLETGQHEDDQVSVIDINKQFLSEILPTTQDLEYLAHVRQVNEFEINIESVDNIEQLPKDKEHKNIVFVGKIGDNYYVRIFDNNGTIIIDDTNFNPNQSKEEIENNLGKQSIETGTKAKLIEQLSLDLGYKLYNEPLAVIISNRLPKKNGRSTAYLVSLEERFNGDGNFNYKDPNDKDYIRLVTLKSWSFSCSQPEQNFKGLLKNLNFLFNYNLSNGDIDKLNQYQIPDSLKLEFKNNQIILSSNATLQDQNLQDQNLQDQKWTLVDGDRKYDLIKKNNFLNIYDRSSLLILPQNVNKEADKYLAKGYVPLPHYLRQGGKTYSWYHSPLLPGKNPTDLKLSQLSIRCADQLIAYDPTNGLFDISYAAAWQLGQLLALQDKKFAVSLFNWKRTNAQKLAKDNQQALYPHLFANKNENSDQNSEFPEDVKTWLERLGLLYNIPFNYLVPDEKMLPIESIRFFWLDWFWVESLLDGAFSIGRVQESEIKSNPITVTGEAKIITGFILRSEVVSGWIDLQVDGSNSLIEKENPMEEKLKVLRCDRLSEDVLICLFDGEINTVDISLKPEGLHFGFNNDENDNLWRELRQLDGTEKNDWKVDITKRDNNNNVVNISDLAKQIKGKLKDNKERKDNDNFTSAQFSLQMVQGAEKIRF
jgi:hypothetical protein